MAALDVACSAIRDAHLAAGMLTPTDHPVARRVRAGLRRTYGAARRRQARALSVDELGKILARIDRSSPAGARDAAILLLDYAGALRCSDLAGLDLADLETRSAGLLVTMRRSKIDQSTAARSSASPMVAASSPTRSPPSAPGSITVGAATGRCSLGSTTAASTLPDSRRTRSA